MVALFASTIVDNFLPQRFRCKHTAARTLEQPVTDIRRSAATKRASQEMNSVNRVNPKFNRNLSAEDSDRNDPITTLDPLDDVHAFHHLAEDGVLVVEDALVGKEDIELAISGAACRIHP